VPSSSTTTEGSKPVTDLNSNTVTDLNAGVVVNLSETEKTSSVGFLDTLGDSKKSNNDQGMEITIPIILILEPNERAIYRFIFRPEHDWHPETIEELIQRIQDIFWTEWSKNKIPYRVYTGEATANDDRSNQLNPKNSKKKKNDDQGGENQKKPRADNTEESLNAAEQAHSEHFEAMRELVGCTYAQYVGYKKPMIMHSNSKLIDEVFEHLQIGKGAVRQLSGQMKTEIENGRRQLFQQV